MIDKIEAGKKYKLIDKEGYCSGINRKLNRRLLNSPHIFDENLCVVIEEVDGWGKVDDEYIISPEEYPFFELVEGDVETEEPKVITSDKEVISPETEVTITTTYGELAKVYYVLGSVNGKIRGRSLWRTAGDILNDEGIDLFFQNDPELSHIDYAEVQDKWESLFFKSKEEQEKEFAIKEKRAMIAKLEKEIEKLEEK